MITVTADSADVASGGHRAVRVWDLPTRLFHWLLVAAVTAGSATGFLAPEWMLSLHAWSGYALGALILFRIVWAFFGSEYSRVANFTYSPRTIVQYFRDIVAGRATQSIGHNPAGAAMIFALAAVLAGILVTGLVTLGGQEKQGPLAGVLSYDFGHAAREVHEVLTILLLVLVGLHVAGVVLESLRERSNLVAAMVTGRKRLSSGQTLLSRHAVARPVAAIVILVATGTLIGAGIGQLSTLPPRGVPALVANPIYAKECGACHYDFHPSLLPAASWNAMMADLDDHFGENAGLPDTTRNEITAWLTTNAAERWDTEAANTFRRVSADQPLSVTATRYWKRRHRDIPDAAFTSRPVGAKVNCVACHRDARTGRFDDQSINIPKEQP